MTQKQKYIFIVHNTDVGNIIMYMYIQMYSYQ